MFTRFLSALACLAMAGAVLAQAAGARPAPGKAVLGKAVNVQGLVTVSDKAAVSRVLVNNAVIDHSRYVTSSSGSVTLRMDKGCDIVLKPNDALTVENAKSCEVLWASIESLGNPSGLLLAGRDAALLRFAAGAAAILLQGNGGGVLAAGAGGPILGPGPSPGPGPNPDDDGGGGGVPTNPPPFSGQ